MKLAQRVHAACAVGRAPRGARGLKPAFCSDADSVCEVAPRAGRVD